VAPGRNFNTLDKIQNCCMRLIVGFRRTTPIHIIQAITCIEPMDIRRKILTRKEIDKIIARDTVLAGQLRPRLQLEAVLSSEKFSYMERDLYQDKELMLKIEGERRTCMLQNSNISIQSTLSNIFTSKTNELRQEHLETECIRRDSLGGGRSESLHRCIEDER
jgi:hypothetical protein